MTRNKYEILNEQQTAALRLHEEGRTYKEIGIELGVSVARARQVVASAKNLLSMPADEWPELSERARNALKAEGYDTKEKVLSGVMSGDISPGNNRNGKTLINYGRNTHQEVLDWLGIDSDPGKQEIIDKYIEFLNRHGYKVTKIS